MAIKITNIPVSYFSMVLGISGLGLAWRLGARGGLLPSMPGEILIFLGVLLWIFLTTVYILKWIRYRQEAFHELYQTTIQCCFISLLPIATLLVGMGILPYAKTLAWVLFIAGIAGQLLFAAYRSAGLWRGEQQPEATTPFIYLPTVATNFVSATVLGTTGWTTIGILFFGAGLFSWMGLEAAIQSRLRTLPALPAAVRPVLGIELAPPFVGCVAYLSLNGGNFDILAFGLVGYGILQAIFLLRLLFWVSQKTFSIGFWAFSFGLASMANCGIRMIIKNPSSEVLGLGWALFLTGSIGILILILLTLRYLFFASKS